MHQCQALANVILVDDDDDDDDRNEREASISHSLQLTTRIRWFAQNFKFKLSHPAASAFLQQVS